MPELRRRGPQSPRESLRLFTNRDNERAEFARFIDPTTRRRPVLHFYGVGGTGKTHLLDRLGEDAREAGLPTARLDFDTRPGANPLHGNEAQALGEIRQQLGVECPRFDLAMAWLRFRETAGSTEPLALDNWAKTAGGLVSELATAAASDVPGANVALWVLRKVTKPLKKRLQNSALLERVKNEGLKDFFLLKRMSKKEIYSGLATRLCDDLRDRLPERGNGCRAVVFIDTFEALRGGLDASARENLENWVHDLALTNDQDGPLLMVIAGRDRLRWADRDADWSSPSWLVQHCLGGLSERDARDLLARMGLDNRELQDAILRASRDFHPEADQEEAGFHALSLATCGNAALNEQKRGTTPDPSSFELPPNDWQALARRFLESLSTDADRDWLRVLALTPRFDREAAVNARSPIVESAWDGLLDFSFVQPIEGEADWWRLHAQMTDALREVLAEDESRWTESHERWQARWSDRSQADTDVFAGLAWYHEYVLSGETAHDRWKEFAETARRSLRMHEHHDLLTWWHPVALFENPKSPESAFALLDLGKELLRATLGDFCENLRHAITCFEAALHVFTEEDFPQKWATTQNNLGIAWWTLPRGDRSENLQRAIGCCEAALRVFTEEDFPREWAMTQNNLGNAWSVLPTGDRSESLRRAITCFEAALRVQTEEDFPQEWAMTQNNLGSTWSDLPTGDQSENLQRAMTCYEAALRVHTEEAFPQNWAATQRNLGSAWSSLPTGDRGENLQRAITCYEAALRVFTEEDFPQKWAATQRSLGGAWRSLPTGDQSENLRRAMTLYEAALRVYSEEDFPQEWATTQVNLGNAWSDIPGGDPGENLKRAMTLYEAALRVFTEESFPKEWATTQSNLGSAWSDLPTGDPIENVRRAFSCSEAALRVFSEEDFPQDWAMTQNNLGQAWSDLPTGIRSENLERAIACYEDALRVYTEEAFPGEHTMVRDNLRLAADELRSDGEDGGEPRE